MRGATFFDDDETVSIKDFIDGSARLALQTDPPFSKYTFIEKNRKRFHELAALKGEFTHIQDRIQLVNSEANAEVQRICRIDWLGTNRRAVMFLDPYGAQVEWDSIEAIAKTQAIDLWILFPLSTVNRLLNRNGRIKEDRRRRLNFLFGNTSWFDDFYQMSSNIELFGQDTEERYTKTASFEKIAEYFQERLRTSFHSVAPNPLVLRNSSNSPMFLLCFAAGNPRGGPIAVKIAEHILGKK